MRIPTLMAAALIAGCATPSEVIQTPPDATLTLQNKPEMAVACMARNIENISMFYMTDRRPMTDGWELVSKIEGIVPMVATVAQVRPSGTGSQAQIWSVGTMPSLKPEIIASITKGC